ncbi:hypothetical protein [Paraburkholderia sp. DHOC27]|uniref:hypothetical protein n=1 Tax=Paraburkholderia sp. DHOC27 TaxID=2303330 RepID=UPI0011C0F312|nr:hypothetical protein [Paraburkholderia sp. DHOC27]
MQLEITLCTFYSMGDERRFFEGLNGIAAIKRIQGVGKGLEIDIDIRYLTKDAVWDLIALLWRYGIPLAPLRELAARKKFAWLSAERFYWHKSMFETRSSRTERPSGRARRM